MFFVVSFTQEVFAVDKFGTDTGSGEGEAEFRCPEFFELGDSKEDVFPRGGKESSPVSAVNGEKNGVDSLCEEGCDGLGSEPNVAEYDQLFNVFQQYPGDGFTVFGEDEAFSGQGEA